MILSILLFALSFTLISSGATECIAAGGVYTGCVALNALNAAGRCTCAKDYRTTIVNNCGNTAADSLLKVAACNTKNSVCDTETKENCESLCGALADAIPGFKQTFASCASVPGSNICACFNNLTNAVAQYNTCPLTKSTQLSACIRARLDCTSMSDPCNVDVSIPLEDLRQYWQQYQDKFTQQWKNGLATVQTVINNVVADLNGAVWTWKVSITFPDTSTIDVVSQKVKAEFSKTVGLSLGDIKVEYTAPTKRFSQVDKSSEVTLSTTGSTSGGVALNPVLLAPLVVILNFFLLFLFF